MRDPNRLDEFYEILKQYHKQYVPDWRFGQLFNNLQRATGCDLFYYEEDRLIELLERYFEEWGEN